MTLRDGVAAHASSPQGTIMYLWQVASAAQGLPTCKCNEGLLCSKPCAWAPTLRRS
eukprot:CAMPEP_0179146962 /NCGR_PEP_ID=MMETSP0796-20121207/71013_1 /TAXON_ID=73915 /ORGANISM="Pyrodinium bahamense, Strain pbaha01" /LENGTH=55 /DNA_ID=CAMNT_0020847515 /DNA_START=73 /DNA_END=240 /DNA_ORIENTATION=+